MEKNRHLEFMAINKTGSFVSKLADSDENETQRFPRCYVTAENE